MASSRTSPALTEVRTVLSRAETALEKLAHDKRRSETVYARWNHGRENPGWGWETYIYRADPEIDQMIEELTGVVDRLRRWERRPRFARYPDAD